MGLEKLVIRRTSDLLLTFVQFRDTVQNQALRPNKSTLTSDPPTENRCAVVLKVIAPYCELGSCKVLAQQLGMKGVMCPGEDDLLGNLQVQLATSSHPGW